MAVFPLSSGVVSDSAGDPGAAERAEHSGPCTSGGVHNLLVSVCLNGTPSMPMF